VRGLLSEKIGHGSANPFVVDRSVGWLVGWLVRSAFVRSFGRVSEWLAGWLAGEVGSWVGRGEAGRVAAVSPAMCVMMTYTSRLMATPGASDHQPARELFSQ